MRIVVNGAGIAGPTLAWWLRRSGHEILLVEEAPAPRRSGYVIDFWGAGYDVAERMGLLPRIEEAGYHVREVRFVDGRGRRTGGFPVTAFVEATGGRFVSVRRSDLAAIILDALGSGVETLFGDSVAGVEPAPGGVRVAFRHAPPCDADLVIGADGLHSRVRQIVFAPAPAFEHSLGYHVAACELAGYRPREELVFVTHGVPGRQVSRFSMRDDRTLVLFVLRDEYLRGARPAGRDEWLALLRDVFRGVGWECPALLDAAERAHDELYFDSVSQVRMPRWTAGRTALVGDAGACVSLLAGEGTGLAMLEAYVLAGELAAAGDDFTAAFARYEARLRPIIGKKQKAAARFAAGFAPATGLGVAARDLLSRALGIPRLGELLVRRSLHDDFAVPDYGLPGERR